MSDSKWVTPKDLRKLPRGGNGTEADAKTGAKEAGLPVNDNNEWVYQVALLLFVLCGFMFVATICVMLLRLEGGS